MLKIPGILKQISSADDEMTYIKIVSSDEVGPLPREGYTFLNESVTTSSNNDIVEHCFSFRPI